MSGTAAAANNDRIIIHCDCNSFYASVETVLRPELADVPMAVAGDPTNRHGIILAKNEKAKKYNIQTAETIWSARKKCPDLVLVPPHHDLYHDYYVRINEIYLQYTDLVEPFSIDESFLDVTHTIHLFDKTPKELADEIRRRIREEIGITVSAGVSFCKVFAKLGSDYKKPDATTVIFREDLPEIVYPLPVGALLFVGRKSAQVLESYSIKTCGDLANYDKEFLMKILGKQGETLYRYIHCEEDSPVRSFYEKREAKSIGNSMTFPVNLLGEAEVKSGILALSDSVASRLRRHGKRAQVIQVTIRDPDFKQIQRQRKLETPTHLQRDIFNVSVDLVRQNWDIVKPVRLLGVTGADLLGDDEQPEEQLSLFDLPGAESPGNKENGDGSGITNPSGKRNDPENQEKIESALDKIRDKYGKGSISLGFAGKDNGGWHKK